MFMESTNDLGRATSVTAAQKQRSEKRDASWRLSFLATPKTITPKYQEPPYVFHSGVRPEALKAPVKERDVQMAIPNLRRLYVNKRLYTGLPDAEKGFAKNIDKLIEDAWNSTYNEYHKAKRDRRLKQLAKLGKKREKPKKLKRVKSKKVGKKGKTAKKGTKADEGGSVKSEDVDKKLQEWIDRSSQPKKVPQPEPINRGPIVDLDEIKGRLDIISTPNMVTEKYVPRRPPKHIVKESALTYIASERVLEISKPAAYRLVKEEPIILGSVSPAALRYKTTDNDKRLATPRARASANDADVKDDPFAISKNALKYKATPRIIELAKPVERK